MNSPALTNLLAAIRSKEAPKGYGQIYSGARGVSLTTDVSKMTLDQVLAFQKQMLRGGSASTACGGYQFLRKTLLTTIVSMGLSGKEVWKPDLQDRMAVQLMEGRGFGAYMAGTITAEVFCNNLAKEWASLPVVTSIEGSEGFVLKPGQSYYAGDGLNSAHHKPAAILALVKALKSPAPQPSPPPAPVETAPPATEPAAPPPATVVRRGFWAWLWSLFT